MKGLAKGTVDYPYYQNGGKYKKTGARNKRKHAYHLALKDVKKTGKRKERRPSDICTDF